MSSLESFERFLQTVDPSILVKIFREYLDKDDIYILRTVSRVVYHIIRWFCLRRKIQGLFEKDCFDKTYKKEFFDRCYKYRCYDRFMWLTEPVSLKGVKSLVGPKMFPRYGDVRVKKFIKFQSDAAYCGRLDVLQRCDDMKIHDDRAFACVLQAVKGDQIGNNNNNNNIELKILIVFVCVRV